MPHPHAYPPEARVRRPQDFRTLLDQAEVFPGRQALVRRLLRGEGVARLGLSVPRGYGGAVRRNRFRRLVREVFRGLRTGLAPMDLLVSPRRGGGEPTLLGLAADVRRAVQAAPGSGAPPRRPRT